MPCLDLSLGAAGAMSPRCVVCCWARLTSHLPHSSGVPHHEAAALPPQQPDGRSAAAEPAVASSWSSSWAACMPHVRFGQHTQPHKVLLPPTCLSRLPASCPASLARSCWEPPLASERDRCCSWSARALPLVRRRLAERTVCSTSRLAAASRGSWQLKHALASPADCVHDLQGQLRTLLCRPLAAADMA